MSTDTQMDNDLDKRLSNLNAENAVLRNRLEDLKSKNDRLDKIIFEETCRIAELRAKLESDE